MDNMTIISAYTRADALEDGTLVDLNQTIPQNESGYKYPVACTSSVWGMVEDAVKNDGKDYAGVVWDILWMSKVGVVQRSYSGVMFKVTIGKKTHKLKILCHPGDTPEPVLTVMMPDED